MPIFETLHQRLRHRTFKNIACYYKYGIVVTLCLDVLLGLIFSNMIIFILFTEKRLNDFRSSDLGGEVFLPLNYVFLKKKCDSSSYNRNENFFYKFVS